MGEKAVLKHRCYLELSSPDVVDYDELLAHLPLFPIMAFALGTVVTAYIHIFFIIQSSVE